MLLVKKHHSDVASRQAGGLHAVALFVSFGEFHFPTSRLLDGGSNCDALAITAVGQSIILLFLGPRAPRGVVLGKAVGVTTIDAETVETILNESMPVVGILPNHNKRLGVHTEREGLLVFNFDHLDSPFLGYGERVSKSL